MEFKTADDVKRYPVKTNMRVLMALRGVMKELGLQGLISGGRASSKDIIQAVGTAIIEADLVNEFCQIVTDDKGTDFREEEIGTVMWVINDFFVAIWWQMPQFWKEKLAVIIRDLMKMGQIAAMQAMTGGTIQPTGSIMSGDEPSPEI